MRARRSARRVLARCKQLSGKIIVFSSAGGQHFALITAHAPTSAAALEDLRQWWHDLASKLRRIPKHFRLMMLVDANARFSVAHEAGNVLSAFPEGQAAEMFQDLLHNKTLISNDLPDTHGKPVITWVSPNGDEACLDYITISADIVHGLRTIGNIPHFSDCFDFDHRPLLVCLSWSSVSKTRIRQPRLDRKAMMTDWGKLKLAEIFATAPLAPWASSADDYVNGLNEHLLTELRKYFTQPGASSRHPYASDDTWSIVRARRSARRVLARCKQLSGKITLQINLLVAMEGLFASWT